MNPLHLLSVCKPKRVSHRRLSFVAKSRSRVKGRRSRCGQPGCHDRNQKEKNCGRSESRGIGRLNTYQHCGHPAREGESCDQTSANSCCREPESLPHDKPENSGWL